MKKRYTQSVKVLLLTLTIIITNILSLPYLTLAASSNFNIVNGVLISYSGIESTVTIPAGVTSIGDYAFCPWYGGNAGLENIIIPEGVTSIGKGAFEVCISLKSVTFPKSLQSIGGQAFYGCSNLTNADIPDNVTSIGISAFYK